MNWMWDRRKEWSITFGCRICDHFANALDTSHLQILTMLGVISRNYWLPASSKNPEAHMPIVIVQKKNGGLRMCIDYRMLNRRTVPDQYTTPRIDEALDCLSGSKWFSVLDLRSGITK